MVQEHQAPEPDETRRKRPRAARACQFCRAKKYKCDELRPCTQCKRSRVTCVYEIGDQVACRIDYHVRAESSTARHDLGDNNLPQREFHGQTSSMAFLAALGPDSAGSDSPLTQRAGTLLHDDTFVSTFQNDSFSPPTSRATTDEDALLQTERFHFKQSRMFLDGHFQNIHFVHPILDKTIFMNRCEDLWFGTRVQLTRSFIALYYSVMSLGALVRTWDDGETIDGKGRLQWSRKLFHLATIALAPARLCTDLDTIQSCFFLAKVCQNELNPSMAYMYLGLATRSSFAAGINRRPRTGDDLSSNTDQRLAQRTWWGLYALEIELSFALGRPDSLGPDQYHNLELPYEDRSETAIIPALVQLARIIRRVCTEIYLSEEPLDARIGTALKLDKDLDNWLTHLPEPLRPTLDAVHTPTRIRKDSKSCRLQQLVLSLRYYNVKMILLRPFLAKGNTSTQPLPPILASIISKCVNAGRDTITHMHEVYVHQPFFRTWWNNTTYVLYAASTVLWYTFNLASLDEGPMLLDLGDKAIDILEAMEESVVASNACQVIKDNVSKAREKFMSVGDLASIESTRSNLLHSSILEPQGPSFASSRDTLLQDMDWNLDFFDMTFPMDEMRSAFWRNCGNPGV